MGTEHRTAAPHASPAPQPRARTTAERAPRAPAYWIAVASRDHVERGIADGVVQVSHGKAGPLERMQPGDGLLYYSPRAQEGAGDVLMAFTALALITPGAIDSAQIEGTSCFRRAARYLPGAPVPIKPLLPDLSFIRSKTHWGATFRFGFLRIPAQDFAYIARLMGCDPAAGFGIPPVAATAG